MRLNFSHLVLGEGACFGKGKGGTPDAVKTWGEKFQVEVIYLPKTLYEGLPVSSGRIRKCVLEGDLKTASLLLGRPYSIYAKLLSDGFLDLPLSGFCFPPEGVYKATYLGKPILLTVAQNGVYLDKAALPSQKEPYLICFE